MKKPTIVLTILIFICFGNQHSVWTQSINIDDSRFVWDFSKQRKLVYSFSQHVSGENKMGKDQSIEKSHLTGNGHLNIRVKENHLADLSLTDIEMKMVMYNEDGTPGDSITQKAPTSVVQDMRPDGGFGDPNTDVLFDMLFPLPNKNIEQGESDEIPMQMPFNAFGSRLIAKGKNTLAFVGYEEIEGRNCAVLKGTIDISKLDIPEELKGEYRCSTSGNGTYYFDVINGYYVGADVTTVMEVMMNSSEIGNEFDLGIFTSMKSVYKIRLIRIER